MVFDCLERRRGGNGRGMDATTTTPESTSSLPRLSVGDTLRFVRDVGGPLVARGLIIRRPRVVRALEVAGADRRAVAFMARMRDRYGDGPIQVAIPGRSVALVVSPDHVHEILDSTPHPFHPATTEKRSALDHFQPEGVLATRGPERDARRRLNEDVLEQDRPRHGLAERFDQVVDEEARWIAAQATGAGVLDWDTFERGWERVVRRVVLGDAARDDMEVADLVTRLRKDANWAFAKPVRRGQRRRFHKVLGRYLERAEPGSLAAVLAEHSQDGHIEEPAQQFPQWLFAFDPAGMATYRALALLAVHPRERQVALAEAEADDDHPLLRAAVLESLRLWPTTPGILRELTTEHRWAAGTAPEGTTVMIFTPLFHRHPSLPDADTYSPRRWLDHRSAVDWPLVPFSGGPAMCPGRNVVLTTTSAMLLALHRRLDLTLTEPGRLDPERLPSTLDPYTLEFTAAGRSSERVTASLELEATP